MGARTRSQRRRRAPAGLDVPDNRTRVECACDARRGVLWPDADRRHGLDGYWFTSSDGETKQVRHVFIRGRVEWAAHPDWLSVDCVRCGRTWQGRQAALLDAVTAAPGGVVVLGDRLTVRPRR